MIPQQPPRDQGTDPTPDAPYQLRLACPKCGGWKLVAWDNLNHLLHCRNCDQWYRVDSARLAAVPAPAPSELEVAVRSGFSEWVKFQRPALSKSQTLHNFVQQSRRWLVEHPGRCGGVGLSMVVFVSVLLWAVFHDRGAEAKEESPLPSGLEARASLLAEAWLAKDTTRMLRLTDPSLDRDLRRWLAYRAPPTTVEETLLDKRPTCLVQSVQPKGSERAEVTVQIDLAPGNDHPRTATMKQWWVCRQSNWYFVPQDIGHKSAVGGRIR